MLEFRTFPCWKMELGSISKIRCWKSEEIRILGIQLKPIMMLILTLNLILTQMSPVSLVSLVTSVTRSSCWIYELRCSNNCKTVSCILQDNRAVALQLRCVNYDAMPGVKVLGIRDDKISDPYQAMTTIQLYQIM